MRNYLVFLRKEFLESIRTYKLFIMLIVFLIFGMMSPLTAKLTPELLSSFMPEGIEITLTEPAAIDSWTQFFKNISQMGLIATVILFSGILSTELSKGTLINMLTKGLSRNTVILAKFTVMIMIWTISYVASFLVTLGYTVYLFPNGDISQLFFSIFCLWLFGVFLLSILLFAGTFIKNNYGCLLITGVTVSLLGLFNLAPRLQKYNPLSLATNNVPLLTNNVAASELFPAVSIAIICSFILLIAAIFTFRKRQL